MHLHISIYIYIGIDKHMLLCMYIGIDKYGNLRGRRSLTATRFKYADMKID